MTQTAGKWLTQGEAALGSINSDDGHNERIDPLLYSEAIGLLTKTDLFPAGYIEASDNTQKTKDMQRSDILRFEGAFPHFEGVTNKEVRAWFRSLGVKVNTQLRIKSSVSSYWSWCVEEHDLSVPPCLDAVVAPRSKSKSARKQERHPYTDKDYKALFLPMIRSPRSRSTSTTPHSRRSLPLIRPRSWVGAPCVCWFGTTTNGALARGWPIWPSPWAG